MKKNQRPGTGKVIVACTYCKTPFERYASQTVDRFGRPRKIIKCPNCRTVPPERRFSDMVEKLPGENACWLFRGCRNPDGYGHFQCRINGKHEQRSNRVAYLFWRGPIPKDKFVLHTCSNRCCVNPHHLYLGTQSQNTFDQVKDGTHHFSKVHGEKHYNAKMSDEDVKYIRANYKGYGNGIALAEKFKVSIATIRDIAKRRSWKHVID